MHFCTKNVDFSTTPRASSLEAQRLDDPTGHTRRPKLSSDQIFPSLTCPKLDFSRPELAETGPKTAAGDGKRRHVRESIGLSSQIAPQTPQETPRTPRQASQEVSEKIGFFQKKQMEPLGFAATFSPSPAPASWERVTSRRV